MGRKRKNKAVKYKYTDADIHFSSNWVIDNYISADDKRQSARKLNAELKTKDCIFLLNLIKEKEIYSFCRFVDLVNSQYPEYASLCIEKATFFNYVINSRLKDLNAGLDIHDYSEMAKAFRASQAEELRLNEVLDECRRDLCYTVKERTKLEEEVARLHGILDQSNLLVTKLVTRNQELANMLEFEKII